MKMIVLVPLIVPLRAHARLACDIPKLQQACGAARPGPIALKV